jgi:hypothetical protein
LLGNRPHLRLGKLPHALLQKPLFFGEFQIHEPPSAYGISLDSTAKPGAPRSMRLRAFGAKKVEGIGTLSGG